MALTISRLNNLPTDVTNISVGSRVILPNGKEYILNNSKIWIPLHMLAMEIKDDLINENLNSIINFGIYHQNSNINATIENNYPTNSSGVLKVYVNNNNIFQEYHVLSGQINENKIYSRSKYAGFWSNWIVPNYVDINQNDYASLISNNHNHLNKNLLDTYNQTNEDLTDSVNKKHIHNNINDLNNINSTKINNWDNAYSWGNHNLFNYLTKTLGDDNYLKNNGINYLDGEITITDTLNENTNFFVSGVSNLLLNFNSVSLSNFGFYSNIISDTINNYWFGIKKYSFSTGDIKIKFFEYDDVLTRWTLGKDVPIYFNTLNLGTINQNKILSLDTAGKLGYIDGIPLLKSELLNNNIGVGTNTPSAKLDVNGTAYIRGDLRFGEDFNDNTGIIKWQSSASQIPNSVGIFTWEDAKDIQIGGRDVVFKAEALTAKERLRIASNGNIGIGTATPAYPLDINSSSNILLRVKSTADESYINMQSKTSDTSYGALLRNRGNDFGIYHGDTVSTSLYINGVTRNIGIGTESPTEKLTVNGNILLNDSFALLGSKFGVKGEMLSYNLTSQNTRLNYGFYKEYNGIDYYGYNHKWYHTNDTVSMIIDSNLNVGIGITTPTDKLEVRKDLNTNDYLGDAQHRSQFQIGKTSDEKSLEFAVLDNGTGVIQSKEGGVGYHNLSINPAAVSFVGIGTTTPASKLHVKGGTQSSTITRANATATFECANGVLTIGQYTDGITSNYGMWLQSTNFTDDHSTHYFPLNLQPAGGNTLINPKTGNVGIGTELPTAKLDVNGNIKSNSFIKNGGTSSEFLKADGSIDNNNYVKTTDLNDKLLDVIGVVVDAGENNIVLGSKGIKYIPNNCIIKGWDIRANKIGNIEFDILVNNNSIIGSTNPKLISQINNTNLNLTDWTINLNSGDIVEFIVNNNSTINKVTLSLIIQK